MNSRDAPTFEFAERSPVQTGQKHRRGIGHATNSRKISAASQSSSLSAGVQPMTHQQQTQSQTSYYTTDAWDNADIHHRKDDNACNGSLTYSSCSSEGNAGSACKTSFADIIKIIESEVEGEGASDLKTFMSKKSVAASDMGGADYSSGGGNRECGGQFEKETAVAGWMQRAETRSMHKLKEQQTKVKKQTSTAATAMDVPSNSTMDLKSILDYRDEGCVFGVDFEENFLETIAGHDDDRQDAYQPPFASARNSSSRDVTPPPNSRHGRTSTSPPGANTLSRTNSHHSNSSSDESWETPIPSSPPKIGATMMKPPQARSSPISKSRCTSGSGCEKNEAFYAKPWMGGFSDAFNFDGFDKDEAFDFDGFKFRK